MADGLFLNKYSSAILPSSHGASVTIVRFPGNMPFTAAQSSASILIDEPILRCCSLVRQILLSSPIVDAVQYPCCIVIKVHHPHIRTMNLLEECLIDCSMI